MQAALRAAGAYSRSMVTQWLMWLLVGVVASMASQFATARSSRSGTLVEVERPPCLLATMPVAVAANASEFELAAADELAHWGGQVGGRSGPLDIVDLAKVAPNQPHFALGVRAALAAGVPATHLSPSALGDEGFLASNAHAAGIVALSGAPNATRGTLYAAYHFLWLLGVRFLAENATIVPACPVVLPQVNETNWRPAFEYRAVNSWAALSNPLHAQRLHLNDGAHLRSSSFNERRRTTRLPTPSAVTSPYVRVQCNNVHTAYSA
jgi:hypothetical protein